MSREILTVQPGQPIPEYWDASIYIGLPRTAFSRTAALWTAEIIDLLEKQWAADGRLVIFLATLDGNAQQSTSDGIINWNRYVVAVADVLMLWWPRDPDPAWMQAAVLAWEGSRKVLWGMPENSSQNSPWMRYASKNILSAASSPRDMANKALDIIGGGAARVAGEREIPLHLWITESFQRWYSAQTAAGNQLRGARLVWTFHTGPEKQLLLYWALHVSIWVEAEDRIKSNEVVVSRPDISVLALYRRRAKINDTTIILVREFRSPASTPDGLVHELPSGSGSAHVDAALQAVIETEEETGFAIDAGRVRAYGSRQLAATMSAHHAHLYAAEITDEEISRLREAQTNMHGAGDTEQTWTEITTFGDLRRNRLVDWSTLGMISAIMLDVSESTDRPRTS
jgi:hypothetical protein